MEKQIIFDFNKISNIKTWTVINDAVMGGKSEGDFFIDSDGNGVFEGDVSLENNGGFSSVKYSFSKIDIKNASKINLVVKGDGKNYQFRLKGKSKDKHSFVSKFSTTGEWQEIEIQLKDMYPSFRGKKLEISNFSEDSIEEIAFLIGNKSAEHFKLIIDKIEFK
mgnify:CR=1 FL=1